MRAVVPSNALPIIDVLDSFHTIVKGCFGWELTPGYQDLISNFRDLVASLQIYAKVGYKAW